MLFALVLILAVCIAVYALAWYFVVFPIQLARAPHPELSTSERALAGRLRRHVSAIASEPHNVAHPENLEAAASYIESALSALGLSPSAQDYVADSVAVRNIEVVFEPEAGDPGAEPGTYVIGAHYDSWGQSPGANDNATGVAALLELARALRQNRPRAARVRLVFFVNEEPPYTRTENMGSWRYAKRLSESKERVLGMICLETLGFFSSTPGTQHLPFPFSLIFGSTGDFLAFVALPGSRRLLRHSLRSFRRHNLFPSCGAMSPYCVAGADASDHLSFAQFGFPAVMVTDTAMYRNPHYHRENDAPDTVDYENLARITPGLIQMVFDLTARRPPLRTGARASPGTR